MFVWKWKCVSNALAVIWFRTNRYEDILSGCRCWHWIWISAFRPAHFLSLILKSEPPIENSNGMAKSNWRYTTDWAHKLPLWQYRKRYTGYGVVRSLPLNNRSKRSKKGDTRDYWNEWFFVLELQSDGSRKFLGKIFFFIIIFAILFIIKFKCFELSLTCESWMKNSKERFFRLASSLYWTRYLAQQYYVVSVASFFLLKTFLSSYFNFQFFFLEFHNGYLCLLEWILFNVYEFNAK